MFGFSKLKYSIRTELCRRPLLLLFFLIFLIFDYIIINTILFSKSSIKLSTTIEYKEEYLEQLELIAEWSPEWENKWNSINCDKIFDGGFIYALTNKIQIGDPLEEKNLPMDCKSIKNRNGMADSWIKNTTKEEKEFPLAFTRIVYKDYLLLEMELALHYTPENWYCYVVDSKSSPLFYSRLQRLSKCFPNIIIAEKRFNISRAGHNTSNAMIECANILAKPERRWNYLINLQNHDIQAKTNAEMVRIFSLLDGANDVEICDTNANAIERIKYYLDNFIWSFEELKLYKNDSKNKQQQSLLNIFFNPPKALTISKGYSAASISRDFVDFITKELNLEKLLEQLNKAEFGVDEHLWQTLSISDDLNAPGGFTEKCYISGYKTPFITRYALWENTNCFSRQIRHDVCVFGLEDLTTENLFNLPHLFINKMMPQYDFGVIKCWHKKLIERQKINSERKLNLKYYENWPQTIYNQMRRKNKGKIKMSEFKCE
ncbi:hypothetical protein ACQ4LE_010111 [Meloidogyne hapla]|uniref:Uncharacterized protein n=1 Tax=Meloidogyne hapla TaxID=6305 RepID=A0A1I8C0W5_MELHA